MPRYKDLLTPALLRKEYPIHIEVPLPYGGFRLRLNLIEQWLTDYTEHPDFGRWSTTKARIDHVTWAFKDEIIAQAFRAHLEMVLKLTDRQVLNRLTKRGTEDI
ncbi:MAG: hypothetical protein CTR53_05135 [Ferrovibrio sp.]|nr:MAG: hypothetical protein CTR53_05135 [Ferrovibrio sp.]